MRITFIRLVNFSNVKTAFKCKEISIDLKESKNRIILLTGPNGSGKTSILSCIHPFATNGNLDVRSDNPLVLIGKEGYKEIQILDNGNEYTIKHYYLPNKETHSIKSYINRNGIELNPNGNVTSFKERVKEEFDIEMDYLKLIRLGSNVTNFIDHKTTDRKSYMGKLLDSVDIYLKYFKKITNDMRVLKSVISHLLDKMEKLNIYDEKELKKTQKYLKEKLEEYRNAITSIESKLSIIDYEIKKYDDPSEVKNNLINKEAELNKIYKILKKKDLKELNVNECKEIINKLSEEITNLEISFSILMEKRSNNLAQMNSNVLEIDNLKREISKIEDNDDVKNSEYIIEHLKEQIQTRSKEKQLAGYEPTCSKKDLENLIVTLDKCNDILKTTYEFGKEPIKKAIEFILKREDIETYVRGNRENANKNKLQSMAEYVFNHISKKISKVNPDCSKQKTCNAMRFYNEIYDLATEIPDEVVEDEEFITYSKLAYQNINTVIRYIEEYDYIIKNFPDNLKEIFKSDAIFTNIENLKSLYDKSLLYNELTCITEYELQREDLEKLRVEKDKLKLIKKSISSIDYFVAKKEELEEKVESLSNIIDSIRNESNEISSLLSDKRKEYDLYNEIIHSIENKDRVENEYNDLKEVINKLKSLYIDKKNLESELKKSKYEFSKIEKEFNNNDYRLTSYKDMNKELSSYKNDYEEMTLIRNSLSSKEGIPLLFIQVYLKNIREITNELLDIVYDGDLFIEEFNITANEFQIPFNTKGTSIKDVSYASQGEKSFISLALSFALTFQSISRYNIMLLDEIDSTLDTRNREKFIQILEKQMNMIDSEQVFVISHNNMFNMYPVDVIDTRNKINKENKLANYIKINIAA